MEDKRSVIFSAIIGILVLALIIGVIIYLIRFILSRPGSNLKPSPTPIHSASPIPTNSNPPRQTPGPDQAIYKGQGFEILYPNSWGILTCSNSQNIEFDPTSSNDNLKINCDRALKPITILVNSNTCPGGDEINKGGIIFTKVKTPTSTGVNYKWCTKTTPSLEITHRVSSSVSRATSIEDFSSQVEKLISHLRLISTI